MAERPNSFDSAEGPNTFDSYLCERQEFPSSTQETPGPVEDGTRLPYEIDDKNVDKQPNKGAEKTAVDQPEKDDKQSNDGREQPEEPEEEDASVTVKRRKENKNGKAQRDEPKTKKRAANPDHGSKSEKRRSITSTLPALDEVSNAEDQSREQLELSSPMVSEETEKGNQH